MNSVVDRYHNWKSYVSYDDHRSSRAVKDVKIRQPIRTIPDRTNQESHGSHDTPSANEEGVLPSHMILNPANEDSDSCNEEESRVVSTPLSTIEETVEPEMTNLKRRNCSKPKLKRLFKNASKTEIDSSFELPDDTSCIEVVPGERPKPDQSNLIGSQVDTKKSSGQSESRTETEQSRATLIGSQLDDGKRADQSEGRIETGSEFPTPVCDSVKKDKQVTFSDQNLRSSTDRKTVTFSMTPGPLEMDVQTDQNNVLVNENIWIRFVKWYGVADTHLLTRYYFFFKLQGVTLHGRNFRIGDQSSKVLSWRLYIKMLYLIGPDGLVNLSFENFQKSADDNGTCP